MIRFQIFEIVFICIKYITNINISIATNYNDGELS